MLQGRKLLPSMVNTLKISTAVFNKDHVCEGKTLALVVVCLIPNP